MLHDGVLNKTWLVAGLSRLSLIANKAVDFLRQSITVRCLFGLSLVLFLNLVYLAWKLIIIAIPALHEFVDLEFVRQEIWVSLWLMSTYFFSMLLIWFLRHYHSLQSVLEFFCLQVIALGMAYQGYAFGSVSVVTGMMLMCMSVIGLVLFSRFALYSAVCTGLIVLIGTAYAYTAGFLPYAPKFMYSDMFISAPDAFFLISNNFLFSAPIFLGALFALDFLKTELKKRELMFAMLSRLDPLTQVYNRHVIYEYMNHSLSTSDQKAVEQSDAIILLDMDFFKAINDQHGHQVGDQVLIDAAKVLKDHIREQDLLARFGGEEFIIILPEASIQTAYCVAERCRQAIAALRVPVTGTMLSFTASFGVTISHQRSRLDRQINVADQALYQAKRQGRNCTVVHPSELLVERV